jgi:hypothetical protein
VREKDGIDKLTRQLIAGNTAGPAAARTNLVETMNYLNKLVIVALTLFAASLPVRAQSATDSSAAAQAGSVARPQAQNDGRASVFGPPGLREASEAALAGAQPGQAAKATDGLRDVMVSNGVFFYPLTGQANAQAFGCKPDWSGTTGTDNAACFAALNAYVNGGSVRGTKVFFPQGRYYTTVAPNFTVRFTLEGAGAGMVGGNLSGVTEIWVPAGTTALTLAQPADFSVVRNIVFKSVNAGAASGNDDGIRVRAHGVILENVGVEGFGRDGVNFDCDIGTTKKNCNNWQLRQVVARYNHRHGVYLYGTDAQAGAAWGGDWSLNGKYGLYLHRSAANGWYNIHTELNGTKWGARHPNLNHTDVYLDAPSNYFSWPYLEAAHWFVIANPSASEAFNRIVTGSYGKPTFRNSADGGNTVTAFAATNATVIEELGGRSGSYVLHDPRGANFGRSFQWQNLNGDAHFHSQAPGGTDTRQFWSLMHDSRGIAASSPGYIKPYQDIIPVGSALQLGSAAYPFASAFATNYYGSQVQLSGSASGSMKVRSAAAGAGGTFIIPSSPSTVTGAALELPQTFAGAQTFGGGVTVGSGGAAVAKILRGSASLNFGAIPANSCSSLTVALRGAAAGDEVSLGVPDALGLLAGVSWSAWVSAAGTVTVRGCNVTGAATRDPAAATVKVTVIQ